MDAISRLVIESQQQPENKALRKKVRDVAMELFYSLPKQYHLLPEGLCSAFLLYCEPSIDGYITKYKPVGTFFNFIYAIVKRRVRHFLCSVQANYERINADSLVYAPEALYMKTPPEQVAGCFYHTHQLPTIFETLLSGQPDLTQTSNSMVKHLLCALTHKRVRQGLLLSCVTDPSYALHGYVPLTSKLLGCDEMMLGDFLASLDKLLVPHRQKCSDCLDRVGFRFFQVNKYRQELKLAETKPDWKTKQMYSHNLVMWQHALKDLELKTKKTILCKSKITEILQISSFTITSSLRHWKEALEETLDAYGSKEYLQ